MESATQKKNFRTLKEGREIETVKEDLLKKLRKLQKKEPKSEYRDTLVWRTEYRTTTLHGLYTKMFAPYQEQNDIRMESGMARKKQF